MNLFDDILKDVFRQCNAILPVDDARQPIPTKAWNDVGKHHMILGKETAYELGGSGTFGLSGCLCTTQPLPFSEGVYLYGKDLKDIHKDQSYARIVLIELEEKADKDALYRKLREIDYVRYHIHPEGYMARISPIIQREPVRISKAALKKHMTFADIGQMYLERYQRILQVKCVNVIFVTDLAFDYASLEKNLHKAEQITQSLDHIFTSLDMDCGTCNLKAVCDEIDGLRQLHFDRNNNA